MRYSKKQSKKNKQQKMENLMAGEGVYIYENNTDADLALPKPSIEGYKAVGPRKRFQGDSYFMCLVKTPLCLLRLIEQVSSGKSQTPEIEKVSAEEQIIEKEPEKKSAKAINKRATKKRRKSKKVNKDKKMKEKLILDQPEVVTQSGKLEQVEVDVEEQKENESQEEKLLTENPSGDIEIISE